MAKAKPTPPETGKPDPDTPAPDTPAPDAGDLPADPMPPEDEGRNKPGCGYVCLEPIKRNGKDHAPGDPIELGEADAAPLLAHGAIREA